MSGVIHLQQAGLVYRRYAKPQDALLEWLLSKPRHEAFYALKGVDFTLESGCSLGLVGDNGAGKSTLLRMLAGNLQPTEGRCEVEGQRAALLELGSGLQPEFSGLENIRIGLALRGLDAQLIDMYVLKVLEFAELGEFAEQPVKTYSSGMVVRLVFAVASVVEPDILIVDEALSVGDQYFQKKSLDRMREILSGGATLVFCSHNLYQVREICEQAIWLEQGQVKMLGDAQLVVDAYQDAVRARQALPPPVVKAGSINHTVKNSPVLNDVFLSGTQKQSQGLPCFVTGQSFTVEVCLDTAGFSINDIHVGVVIRRNDDVQCYGISTLHDGVVLVAEQGMATVRFVIDCLPLLAGEYCMEVWLVDGSGVHVYDARERCCHFRVQQDSQAQGVGMNWLPHRWETGKEVCNVTEPL
uniref:Teichoic acid export ATP-binding protein TagH (EC) n=1 Tax=uncultured Thiotrichaceae bacterium TaxID=298394 RepID=A0A6S6T5Z0_9GAMM|nr:MAG: Teichoic acid export ATP-binding protein TagH (EC [uncultured Thiotrichaceae bacterium]